MKKEELLKRTKKELLELAGEEGARLSARLRKSELVDQVMSLLSVRGSRGTKRKSDTVTLKAPRERVSGAASRRRHERPAGAKRADRHMGPPPHELLEITQAISRHFPVPFDRTEIVFLAVDPFRAHAFWHVRLDDMERARRSLGPVGDHAPLLLRVYDVTLIDFDGTNAHLTFDVAVHSLQSHWYFDFWESGRAYIVDIGLQPHDGPFHTLARSNPIQLPPSAPSSNFDRSGVVVDPQINIVCEVADITRAETLADLRPEPRPDMEPAASDDLVRLFYSRLADGNSQGVARPRKSMPEAGDESFETRPAGRSFPEGGVPDEGRGGSGETPETWSQMRTERHIALIEENERQTGGHPEATFEETGPGWGELPERQSDVTSRSNPFPESSYGISQAASREHLSSWVSSGRGVSSWVTSPDASSLETSTLRQVTVIPPADLKTNGSVSEIFADLVVEGRATPDSRFSLFGQTVRLRPDGTFSLRKRLPEGTMVVPLPDRNGELDPEGGSS